MGYYLRMEEILSLQLKSQEQIERWKEELQEVGKTLEVLGDTNELQGEAGTKLKDNIKNIHMPIKTEIEALLDLFQENYSKYVLGFMELEESNTAIIKQDEEKPKTSLRRKRELKVKTKKNSKQF